MRPPEFYTKSNSIGMTKHLLYAFGATAIMAAGAYTVAEEAGAPEESNATIGIFSDPDDGSTVKSISTVKLIIPMTGETQFMPVENKLSEITITKEGGEPVSAAEWGEPSMTGEEEELILPVIFDVITEPGTYTFTVPEGVIAEYDFDGVATGYYNMEYSATFTVDANAASNLEYYTLKPASYATVNKLSYIQLMFERYTMEDGYIQTDDEGEQPTISNGETTYEAYVSLDWSGEDCQTFNINPFDYDMDEDIVITEGGVWTLNIPAGYFTFEGESSPAISASYIVDPNYIPEYTYEASPESGTSTELPDGYDLRVMFTFDGVDEIGFDSYEGELATWVVTYNGESINRVENALGESEDNNGWGFSRYYGGNQMIIYVNRQVFTSPGELVISADEGAYTLDGNPGPEINYTLKVGDIKEYKAEFTPSVGSEIDLTDLKNITIAFPTATSAEYVAENADIMLIVPGGYFSNPEVTKIEDATVPSFKISFTDVENAESRAGGDAKLTIYQGTFILDGVQECEDLDASWKLKRTSEVNTNWQPSPEKGYDIVNYGWGIYGALVFDNYETLRTTAEFNDNIVVKFQGETLAASDYVARVDEGFKLLINLEADKFCNPELTGELQVIIPEGCLTISDVPVPAIDYTWNVVKVKEYTYKVTPSPAEAVGSLAEFTVEFPEAETGVLYKKNFISLASDDYFTYSSTTPSSVEAVEGAEHATFKITFDNPPTVAGNYTLYVNAEAFTLDGSQVSPAIEVNYKFDPSLSGIDGIGDGNNGTVTVVTIDGRVVLKDASASRLSELEKGIYIVNGKKTIIK